MICAREARRSSSRRLATSFMRVSSWSAFNMGAAKGSTVAKVITATPAAIMSDGLSKKLARPGTGAF